MNGWLLTVFFFLDLRMGGLFLTPAVLPLNLVLLAFITSETRYFFIFFFLLLLLFVYLFFFFLFVCLSLSIDVL